MYIRIAVVIQRATDKKLSMVLSDSRAIANSKDAAPAMMAMMMGILLWHLNMFVGGERLHHGCYRLNCTALLIWRNKLSRHSVVYKNL